MIMKIADVATPASPTELVFDISGCPLFVDGFESGDTLAWTTAVP